MLTFSLFFVSVKMSNNQRKDSKVHVYVSDVDKQGATLEELVAMCLNSFGKS